MKTFPCGCSFKTTKEGKVIYDPNIEKLTLDCEATWDMVCEGNTKGVFQLESQLGRSMSKQAKPRNISELADLVAIIRPGCLEAMVKGKSLTQHYIDRKAGEEETEYLHPSLEPILKETYGILVYQEQAILIATEIAGFNLQEADSLRKAIGKKKTDLMAKVKKAFLHGCAKKGSLTKEDAEEIFSWIEKSQRYSFNKSHAVSYAYNAYLTAYTKSHFTPHFFTSYLKHAVGKPDTYWEVHELVNNAKTMGIYVSGPSVQKMNEHFTLINNKPTYGITNVKHVGSSVFKKMIKDIAEARIDINECDWDCFLLRVSPLVNKKAFEALVLSGAFDCFKISRSKMAHQFNTIKELTKRESEWLREYKRENGDSTTEEALYAMVEASRVKSKTRPIFRHDRIPLVESLLSTLNNPGYELYDSPSWIAKVEEELLGISLTCNKVDEYDTSNANCTCKEFIDGFTSSSIAIAVQIDNVREWTIKRGRAKGQKMAFITASDTSCSLDNITAFSEEWEEFKKFIYKGSTVLLRGMRDKGRGSFLVKKAEELTT